MTRLFLTSLIAASLCAPALAAGQSSPAQATPAPQPASTIQANANLVVVDVVVTDAQHNPVHKLSAADFTVLESGHAQTIKTFEEHVSDPAASQLPPLPKLPPGTFTNYTLPRKRRAQRAAARHAQYAHEGPPWSGTRC